MAIKLKNKSLRKMEHMSELRKMPEHLWIDYVFKYSLQVE